MITSDVIIDFKTATPEQKQVIGQLLITQYIAAVDEMIKEGNYICTDGYWKDAPKSRKIMSAKEFIKKYSK